MLMPVISRARSERAKRVGQIRYLLRSDLHIARSSARSQSCYGAVLPMKYRLLRTPTDGPRTSRSLTRKLRGQIPASMPGRVIQERLGPAIRGLNVKHDLDIEPATGSVSSLPGNVCLTRSDGLLIGYKVARQFESHPLRQRVFSFRDSLPLSLKNAHLGGIRHSKSTGEPVSSGFKREFRRFLSVCTFGGGLSVKDSAFDFEQKKVVGGPLFIGACSDRLRKSEGSLLRRPAHWNIKTAGP